MQTVARTLLIYRLTNSGAILGLNALAAAIPMLLLALPGGVMADRISKKVIMQGGQIASAVNSLAVTLALVFGYISPAHPDSWWILVVSAFIQGAIMGIIMPSRQAIISEIVSDEHLMNAISLNNMGMNVFRILSPALAGFLIDAFDFYVVYSINTAMYTMATICIIFVPPTPVGKTEGGNSLTEAIEGWRYLRREKVIFIVLLFTVFVTIMGTPYSQLLPMFTEGILKVDATALGVLISVSGAGAIIGSLILASMSNRKRGLIMMFAGLMMSVALVCFAFSNWWYLSLASIIFVGMGSTGQMALGNSLIQYYVEASYRGRVLSFFMLGFGLGSLGAFFAGILAEAVGVQWAVGGMAIILVVVTVFLLSTEPRLRKLD